MVFGLIGLSSPVSKSSKRQPLQEGKRLRAAAAAGGDATDDDATEAHLSQLQVWQLSYEQRDEADGLPLLKAPKVNIRNSDPAPPSIRNLTLTSEKFITERTQPKDSP